jgi:5-methylcytosine-specific restriction endonuclease McrA
VEISDQHFRRGGIPWETTTPCPGCGGHDGRLIRHPDGKHIVRCVNPACSMIITQLSKAEVEGRRPTAKELRRTISPEKKTSILQRDGMACVFCRRSDTPLHIGHLLSLADAADLGVDATIANHDANLGAMCQECNEGQAIRQHLAPDLRRDHVASPSGRHRPPLPGPQPGTSNSTLTVCRTK